MSKFRNAKICFQQNKNRWRICATYFVFWGHYEKVLLTQTSSYTICL